MTSDNPTASETVIKKYLFAEMSEDEAMDFEQRMFADDDLFFDVADIENRLVDEYVMGRLPKVDLTRFERSLAANPARREKVATARSLMELIEEERPNLSTAPAEESRSFPASAFGGRSLAFAVGALAVLLLIAAAVLFVQNQQKDAELARLKEREHAVQNLQTEIDAARLREAEMQKTIDEERDASGDLAEQLARDRETRDRLEREIERLKNQPPETQPGGQAPLIASVVLAPLGAKGGGDIPTLRLSSSTKRVAMRIPLPARVDPADRFAVALNQKPIARNLAPRAAGNTRSLTLTVAAPNLANGENQIDVTDSTGKRIESYGLRVVR